jgi:hypothetical protein
MSPKTPNTNTLENFGYGLNNKAEIVMWKHGNALFVTDEEIQIEGLTTIPLSKFKDGSLHTVTPHRSFKKTLQGYLTRTIWLSPERELKGIHWINIHPELKKSFKPIVINIINESLDFMKRCTCPDDAKEKIDQEFKHEINQYALLETEFREFGIEISEFIETPETTIFRI